MVQADFDNDGWLDVLVLRGAWLGSQGCHPNSLLRNDGVSGIAQFTDITYESGLAEINAPTQTASWADYDNDGDLDLYIGNETLPKGTVIPCQLFRNNGDRTFSDQAQTAGVTNERFTKAVIWGDYNGDSYPVPVSVSILRPDPYTSGSIPAGASEPIHFARILDWVTRRRSIASRYTGRPRARHSNGRKSH